jgi:hypothetical protein
VVRAFDMIEFDEVEVLVASGCLLLRSPLETLQESLVPFDGAGEEVSNVSVG